MFLTGNNLMILCVHSAAFYENKLGEISFGIQNYFSFTNYIFVKTFILQGDVQMNKVYLNVFLKP